MVQTQASRPEVRLQVVTQALAHAGEYGTVTGLSRAYGVSRQTVYKWREQGEQALAAALAPAAPPEAPGVLERAVLTLLVEGHASERGIAACLVELARRTSVGTIHSILQEAQRRARALLRQQTPAGVRAVALDEIYGNNRQGGYLSVVDAQTGAVWAAAGPVGVDHDSWALLLWEAQEQGLRWRLGISDGGSAMHAAWSTVAAAVVLGRDVWHVLHEWSKVQGRLDRKVSELVARTAVVARQAARLAAGQRPRGRRPQTDCTAHAAALAQAQRTAEGVRYLGRELQTLLEVVVLVHGRVRSASARQADLDSLVALLAELAADAPAGLQREVVHLQTHLSTARAGLLHFLPALEPVQQQVQTLLGAAAVDLLAWAWQRRATLGPTSQQLLDDLPAAWRPAAALLLAAWDQTVRASSWVENWHSVLRPHLAVHRTLSTGMLALLAVWHNHRVAPRGLHQGTSPLSRSDLDADPDWLVALGYPPRGAVATRLQLPTAAHLVLAA